MNNDFPISILWEKERQAAEAVRAFFFLKSWLNHARLAACPRQPCLHQSGLRFEGSSPLKCFVWAPYSGDIWAQASPQAIQTRASHILLPVPLNTSNQKENTESSTWSSLVCVTSHNVLFRPSSTATPAYDCAPAFKYLCNKVILCLCRVPGFFIITQTFNIWYPSSTGKVKGMC